MASSSDMQGGASDARTLKRQLGVAAETVRIKKERLEEAEEAYGEEHRTFTAFSKRLEEKWEQRFDTLVALAADAGVRTEDISAIRSQPWRATGQETGSEHSAPQTEAIIKQPQLWAAADSVSVKFERKERVEVYERERGTGTPTSGAWRLAKFSGDALKQAVLEELEKPPVLGFGSVETRYSDSAGVWYGGYVEDIEPALKVRLDDGRLIDGNDFPIMRLGGGPMGGDAGRTIFLRQYELLPKTVKFSYEPADDGGFEWTGLRDGLFEGDDVFFCGHCTAMWRACPGGPGFYTAFTSRRSVASGCEQCGDKVRQVRVLRSCGYS